MSVIATFWASAKKTRSIGIGPISFFFRVAKSAPIKPHRRHLLHRLAGRRANARITSAPAPSSASSPNTLTGVALIVGAGPGLGESLAKRLASAGMSVALAARNGSRLSSLVDELRMLGPGTHRAYPCDATSETMVRGLIASVCQDIGTPKLMIYAVQDSALSSVLDIEVEALERYWRHLCLGAFICCREVARKMLPQGGGTLVLLGSTSGVLGRPHHLNLAVGKFGLRAMAQVFARELSPLGIHVVHLIIDADVREAKNSDEAGPQSLPEDIADFVIGLHRQPRSAWTHEADIRPYNEAFWEHC